MRGQAHESELSARRAAATGAGAGRVAVAVAVAVAAPCCRASRRCALMRFRWSPCVRCAAFSSASRSRLARLRAPLPPAAGATGAPAPNPGPAPAAGAIVEKSERVERPNVAVPVARAPRCKQHVHSRCIDNRHTVLYVELTSTVGAHTITHANATSTSLLFATMMHIRTVV